MTVLIKTDTGQNIKYNLKTITSYLRNKKIDRFIRYCHCYEKYCINVVSQVKAGCLNDLLINVQF